MNFSSPFFAIAAFLLRRQEQLAAAIGKPRLNRQLNTMFALVLTMLLSAMTSVVNAQSASNLFGGPEPLSPEEAFNPEVTGVSADSIELQFNIADGYYLYRDKSKFSVILPDGEKLDSAIVDAAFSEASIYDDEFFGKSAIFRDTASATLSHQVDPSARSFELLVIYQGCADIGLCYPPTEAKFDIELPASSVVAQTNSVSAQSSAIDNSRSTSGIDTNALQDLFGTNNGFGQEDELLRPEQAFVPLIMSTQADEIELQWQIEPGYYLYRDKLGFTLSDAGSAAIIASDIDEGVMQHDEFFGDVRVLRNIANATLKLNPAVSVAPTQALLSIKYQGCADIGVCFPPETFEVPVLFDESSQSIVARTLSNANIDANSNSTGGSAVATSTTNDSLITAAATASTVANSNNALSEQDRITGLLASKGIWLIVATFFGLGLLLSFTPCVLPMFPILSSLIIGQGDSITTGKAFRLSLVYVLVMAVTYAIVGVLVGMSGYNIQAALQNPWVLSGIALIFVLLSLSMFGLYELQLPVSWQQKLTSWSNNQRGGEYGGVAIMGFISTLIVGPCVTAPLAGALLFIANTGDALTGGIALFALGIGMGVPLLLVGASAGTLVPKAGVWMDKVKHVFGILMIAMAIWMLSRVLPSNVTMGLFGALGVISAVYLGATDTLTNNSSGWQRLGKGSGVLLGLYGLALCVSAMTGAGSYSSPLRSLGNGAAITAGDTHNEFKFTPVKGMDGLEEAIASATAAGKPVLLDFYADWCVSCKEMEAFTFSDKRVQELLENTVVIQADVTANDADDKELLKYFSLFGPPAIIFYDANGKELPAARVVGFMRAKKFSSHIERFIGSSVAAL